MLATTDSKCAEEDQLVTFLLQENAVEIEGLMQLPHDGRHLSLEVK
jgi:hypothetical protein